MDRMLLDLINSQRTIVMPGIYDALSARLAERVGFTSLYLSGSATAASAFGKPDIGLITMSEMAEQCRRVAHSTCLPVMADADTGYGDVNAVRRTIEAFEGSGVAGATLEDQTWPKRCGYMSGLEVVPIPELQQRIEAAVATRRDPRFAVVGRTDSLAVDGLAGAVQRGQAIVESGADMLWIVGLAQLGNEAVQHVRSNFEIPLIVDHTEVPGTLPRTASDYEKMGINVVLFPLSTILVVTQALTRSLTTLFRESDWQPYSDDLANFEEYNRVAGLDEELAFSDLIARVHA
jgi:2,3-dimethylmalate lyase